MTDLVRELIRATAAADLDGIRRHVAAGADLHEHQDGFSPLQTAAFGKHEAAFGLLLQLGADVNHPVEPGMPAVALQALISGCVPIFKKAVEAGARFPAAPDVLRDWLSAAISADSVVGDATATILVLNQGADAKLADKHGDTPLHEAVQNDNPLVCLALVRAGADLNARDGKGSTPLQCALDHRHVNAFMGLRALGARTDGILLPQEMEPHERDLFGQALAMPRLGCAVRAQAGQELLFHALNDMSHGREQALHEALVLVKEDEPGGMKPLLRVLLAHEHAHGAIREVSRWAAP